MDLPVEPLSNQHCNTGENPYWHPEDGCVYWTDIPAGVLYRYDPKTKATDAVYGGEPVGGFTLQADGKFLLFRVKDIASFDIRTHETTVVAAVDDGTFDRFNDVHADPIGRVFAGTMGKAGKKTGGLYRIDLDGTATKLFAVTSCSNGMAFTLDEKQMYWTDTSARKIYRFDYDRTSGALTNQTDFYVCPDEEKFPDGTAMDEHGNLWSTRWGGSRICVIDPAGKKIDELKFPVEKVSCAIFGGEKGNELFVTTAAGKSGTNGEEGTLYRVITKTRGRPRFRSRIKL